MAIIHHVFIPQGKDNALSKLVEVISESVCLTKRCQKNRVLIGFNIFNRLQKNTGKARA